MARPIWKGFITFGLVNIPVILYSAEKKYEIRFKLLDSRNKARIRYERINEETGEEVPWSEVVKGYEYDEGNFLLLKEEDFKMVAGENSKTVNIESFINQSSLDYMDLEKPYYLVPDKKGEKGYVILRETLNLTKKIGIARVMIHTKQYLAALMPYENALVLNILRYHHEIKKPSEFDLPSSNLKDYKVSAKELDIAKQLVASMSVKWVPEDYKDEYRIALEKWIEDKLHQEKPEAGRGQKSTKIRGSSNVIDFVDLLKKSLKKNQKGKPVAAKQSSPKRKKTSNK